MPWYRTGTVAVTNNSNVITGTGTSWVDAAAIGETFLGPDAQVYEITSIVSATSLRVSPSYQGGSATAQSYAIMPTQGYLRDLAAQAAALVSSYQAVRDGAGAGKFAAGTAAAPSVRGAADENTGLNLPGADILQLITNGAVRLQIAADGTPTGVFVDKLPISTATQTAINTLAAACIAVASVGSAPNQVPSNLHLGAMAFQDVASAQQVHQHVRDSRPGDSWYERVSDTQLIKKFHGLDGVVRSITETYA
ncbi:MAG: hypothetical protein RSD82_11480 [Comamonas sp.]